MQNLLLQSPKVNSIDSTDLTKRELMFYEMVKSYYKDKYSQVSVTPYGITELPFADPVDNYNISISNLNGAYPKTAYKQILLSSYENLIGQYGTMFQTTSFVESMQTNYELISQRMNFILDISGSKDEVKEYYDLADFDDPNDSLTLGKKQKSLLVGALDVLTKVYILEYYMRSLMFSTSFDTAPSDQDVIAEINSPSFAKSYIKALMEVSIGGEKLSKLRQTYNEVLKFIKEKSDKEITGYDDGLEGHRYEGTDGGLNYFIDQNMNPVQKQLVDALAANPNATFETLNVSSVLPGPYILPVHRYAGTNLSDIDYEMGHSFEDKPYSLFPKEGEYQSFRNGRFFLQKYLYVEDRASQWHIEDDLPNESGFTNTAELIWNRSKDYKGVVNMDVFSEFLSAIIGSEYIDEIASGGLFSPGFDFNPPLSSCFKSIKLGVRLCYGLAVEAGFEGQDYGFNGTFGLAESILQNYDESEGGVIAGTSTSVEDANEACYLDKSMICADGPNFLYTEEGSTRTVSSFDLQKANGGTFSVIIPILKMEEDIPMSLSVVEMQSRLQSGYYDNQINNLATNLINTNGDEFSAFNKYCFPADSFINFISIYGIQYLFYQNTPAQQALSQAKETAERTVEIILNSKKFDYIG